jgi:galactokinase
MSVSPAALRNEFCRRYPGHPRLIRAPGRVNLIGEHTDYNEGYVFPIAIDRDIALAAAPREDSVVRLYSVQYAQEVLFDLGNIVPDPAAPWSNYIRGVAAMLQERGLKLGGMDAVVAGDVPLGAGLSSSAALEVATACTFQVLFGLELSAVEMALLCQRAENLFVGVNCGIMDQFISRLGQRDHALLIDCRSLEYERVPLAMQGYQIVVANTCKERGLLDSEYNERRAMCEAGVRFFQRFRPQVRALRDVTAEDLARYGGKMPEVMRRRCAHVISENARTLASVAALKAGDLARFGALMGESHESLRDLYEVSCRELDLLVEIAHKVPGVLGSRMTGGGVGGCTVSLVRQEAVAELERRLAAEYPAATGLPVEVYVCQVADGAGEILENSHEKT